MSKVIASLLIVIALWPLDIHAQTCPAECGPAVNAAASAACRRARAAELRLSSEVLPDLAAAQTQRDVCVGERALLERQLSLVQSTPPRRSPWVLRVGLDVGTLLLGAGAGFAWGAGLPPTAGVGMGVGAICALVGRLVLEWVDGR